MAKYEQTINGNFAQLQNLIVNGILESSTSASLEETSEFSDGEAKCSVLVFERYSYSGQNRVSLNVTLFQAKNNSPIHVSAITSGGSQALFFKINTMGEEAFLDKLIEILHE